MERNGLSKKQITSLVIGVLTMVLLVFGATYAYFSVSIGNTSDTTTITGDIGGGTIGTVTLSGGGTNLYLGISADDMSESKAGTTYYSSTTQGSRETNVNSAGKATYTATLSGDESDEVMYACDYEFTVTSSGTALNSEHLSDISVVFEGDINKTVALSSSQTVKGTWYGFKNSNKERTFNAYLQLNNTESEQNSLAGTNLSVEIENTKWNCYLDESEELAGEAYALISNPANFCYGDMIGENDYCEDGDTPVKAYKITFVRSETPISAGDIHNGSEILAAYTGFEDSADVPWKNYYIYDIDFEDEIRPVSIAGWFNFWDSLDITINVSNLNTSNVTNMSAFVHGIDIDITFIGLENWDTSKVTYMSYMFSTMGYISGMSGIENWDVSNVTNMSGMFSDCWMGDNLNLSKWDVSNVTDMSYMFSGTSIPANIGIGNWDVSNVTDMSYMFNYATINTNLDLSGWDVSNVTNMSSMFSGTSIPANIGVGNWDVSNVTDMSSMFEVAGINTDIDLSSWNVSNVNNYANFDAIYKNSSGTLTPPIWQNLYFGVYSADDYSLRIYNDLNIPTDGDTYEGRTATKVYNISTDGSRPVSCSSTVVPTQIIVEDNISPSSTSSWFSGCTKVNKIDLSKLDTSNVTDMSGMFKNVGSDTTVTSMTIIGIESFNTSKVRDMYQMFYNFGKNATYALDLSGWDVSKITSTYNYQNFNYGVTNKVIAPSKFTN